MESTMQQNSPLFRWENSDARILPERNRPRWLFTASGTGVFSSSLMRSPSLHGLVLLASFAAIVVVGLLHRGRAAAPSAAPAMIAVEHQDPLTVAISVARNPHGRLVELTHSGGKTIFASVPQSWERTEVRGAPLASITADTTEFGFTRWTLPAGATIVFRTDDMFDAISFANPSPAPLALRLVTVDLPSSRTNIESVIVTGTPVTVRLLPDDPPPAE
jgi:hypothetical protein